MKTHRTDESKRYAREAITQLFGLQLRAGTSVRELRKLVSECLENASKKVSGAKLEKGLDLHRLGSVLRTWHKQTQYLTREGLPRSLYLEGKFGLRSLIRTYYPRGKVEAVFLKLKQTGLIVEREGNRWAPTARHARISVLTQETLAHLSEGVARFVETVTQNAAASTKDDLLFERSCKVTRLPRSDAPAFREFARQQAFTFLISVDDWLESRVTKHQKTRKETCTAGVFTFAYIDPTTKKENTKRSVMTKSLKG
ncbi:MAG TPA: hypothetical protein VFU13_17290 [Steroidobacteraceae bacterium]|nr:hypothetical protein [Steroidobacteraceae bacterium]